MTDLASQRQGTAANPGVSTWLSANAGSGKTSVLTNRVARLLLNGVGPQHILCLTYTKAAATEMQNRLFQRLGSWAMRPDATLRDELANLGEPGAIDAAGLSRARQLFARAIDTPGGLRIQTIHSFCATLLRRFPLEAGISPGFTELDDRAARLMRAEIVEELAEDGAPDVVARLALALSGETLGALVEDIAAERDRFAKPLDDAAAKILFGLPASLTDRRVLDDVFLGDEVVWWPTLMTTLLACTGNDLRDGRKLQPLNLHEPGLPDLAILESTLLFASGTKAGKARIDNFPTAATRERLAAIMDRLQALMLRVEAARPLRLGLVAAEKTAALHAFAGCYLPAYEARKAARGLLDFDDLISRARLLLTDRQLADWVLYRLDGGIDHILVDEAQDTSPEQWSVITALADSFTAGDDGSHRNRTLFVVGDKKQSIYSFQGADVAAFDRMRSRFQARTETVGLPFQSLQLEHSFRSSPAVLDVVDAAFPAALWPALGGEVRHLAYRTGLEGRVDLWPVMARQEKGEAGVWYDPVDLVTEDNPAALLADRIAQEIGSMIASGVQIPDRGRHRPMHAGDVLILVQRRSTLFEEVIRACKAAGLPIAGADRLKLGAELAVKDLAALLAFLATPEDDLSLAAVLRSPLCGWTEAQLFSLAHGRDRFLWKALRAQTETHGPTLSFLRDLRNQADFLRPFDLIERVLTRHDGRRKLLARLGPEAEDGIDVLLSQALAYERSETPSLTGFLIWLETDDIDIKRQMDSQGRRIRVMTVHGAKGLEAPIVILPDTADPRSQDRDELYPVADTVVWKMPAGASPPLIDAEQDARKTRRAEENLRLLYVAMTRARCWLIVAAAGDVRQDRCWYNLIRAGIETLSPEAIAGGTLRHAFGMWPEAAPVQALVTRETPLPDWADRPARQALRAPETLSPSALGGAKGLAEPEGPHDTEAARKRGRHLHLLLEHLPAHDPADWPRLAAALIADVADRADLLAEAAGVLGDAALAPLFLPGGLVEVGVSADLAGQRMSGTIDRLILTPGHALIIDFKSNRHWPQRAEDVPEGFLRQMGAYAHAMRQIYPDRRVDTAILWTRAPLLMPLDPEIVRSALERATIP